MLQAWDRNVQREACDQVATLFGGSNKDHGPSNDDGPDAKQLEPENTDGGEGIMDALEAEDIAEEETWDIVKDFIVDGSKPTAPHAWLLLAVGFK